MGATPKGTSWRTAPTSIGCWPPTARPRPSTSAAWSNCASHGVRKRPDAWGWLALASGLLLAAPARADLPPATARAIAIAEDGRRFAPDLQRFLTDADPAVRARAALAVGRLQDST